MILNILKFTGKHIKENNSIADDYKIFYNIEEMYDFFIAGSDQVWNPYFRPCLSLDFLTFAPPKKRIAYAASFGIDLIPLEYEARFKEWIKGMNHLSVREEAGVTIDFRLVLGQPTANMPKIQKNLKR